MAANGTGKALPIVLSVLSLLNGWQLYAMNQQKEQIAAIELRERDERAKIQGIFKDSFDQLAALVAETNHGMHANAIELAKRARIVEQAATLQETLSKLDVRLTRMETWAKMQDDRLGNRPGTTLRELEDGERYGG